MTIWVQRQFSAPTLNTVWLIDITEHLTLERKLLVLRDQGRVLEPDRRLRARRPDDRRARRERVGSAIARRQPSGP